MMIKRDDQGDDPCQHKCQSTASNAFACGGDDFYSSGPGVCELTFAPEWNVLGTDLDNDGCIPLGDKYRGEDAYMCPVYCRAPGEICEECCDNWKSPSASLQDSNDDKKIKDQKSCPPCWSIDADVEAQTCKAKPNGYSCKNDSDCISNNCGYFVEPTSRKCKPQMS